MQVNPEWHAICLHCCNSKMPYKFSSKISFSVVFHFLRDVCCYVNVTWCLRTVSSALVTLQSFAVATVDLLKYGGCWLHHSWPAAFAYPRGLGQNKRYPTTFLGSTSNVKNEERSDVFPQYAKQRLAILDLIVDCVLWLRFTSVCSLFLSLFYFTPDSPLSPLSVRRHHYHHHMLCNHARSANSTAFLFSLAFALMKTYG